jgi:SAM-dependent methyltransferase
MTLSQRKCASPYADMQRVALHEVAVVLHERPLRLVCRLLLYGVAHRPQRLTGTGETMMFHPQGPTLWERIVQALSSTEQGYDLLAPQFDYTPFRTPDAILGPAMAHLGGPQSIATALDMCCGTGAALRHLRPLCRDRVVGIDMSQGMLEVARRMTQEAPGKVLSQSCFFESLGVCKSLNS